MAMGLPYQNEFRMASVERSYDFQIWPTVARFIIQTHNLVRIFCFLPETLNQLVLR